MSSMHLLKPGDPRVGHARVGQWYVHRDKGEMFVVVAVDAESGCVQIQSFDGTLEELDAEGWREMDIEAAEAPEDWTGPFDEIELDDLGLTDTCMSRRDWRASLESLRAFDEAWDGTGTADEIEAEERLPLELYALAHETPESYALQPT